MKPPHSAAHTRMTELHLLQKQKKLSINRLRAKHVYLPAFLFNIFFFFNVSSSFAFITPLKTKASFPLCLKRVKELNRNLKDVISGPELLHYSEAVRSKHVDLTHTIDFKLI